jgi:UDP-3-O-[3-hydroxymyristoyl] glucosamine N-acyltransferase
MEKKQEFTLKELAQFTKSELIGDPAYRITGYAELEAAEAADISFLSKPKYKDTRYVTAMKMSRAGAIFIAPSITPPEGRHYLVNDDPSMAFQKAIEGMRGQDLKHTYFLSIHSSAIIHDSSKIGKNVIIGPHTVIDAHVSIGDDTVIGAGVYIGPHCTLGKSCKIHPNVTIQEHCEFGNNVVLQSGCIVGSHGFGFSTDDKGTHTRITQIGKVIVEDDVEIGSNTTVDRARFTETRIGKGTKIDCQVIIGHNVKIGKHNLICGHAAIAGSTKTGNHVVIAGQVGIDGHLTIDDGVIITAKSGVTKSLERGRYGGYPAESLDDFNRTNVLIRNLKNHVSQIKDLHSRLKTLEEKIVK